MDDRGKKGSQNIKDHRFQIGLPSISDGQLLFLMNMVSKMKHNTELGSRIATVHNGSALFTGDAGGGESEIRKYIIENDWLECIIALPKNIFYNTGIPTYVWIVSNKKDPKRKGKVQLINAMELYEKLRKNLGQKNCEMKPQHIDAITQLYMDFVESDISKIYPNEYFGYNKITVERPLRLSAQFTPEAIATLRFDKSIADEMEWAYSHFGDDLYQDTRNYKDKIEAHLAKNEVKLKPADKAKLLSAEHWKNQLALMQAAQKLASELGTIPYDDFNDFVYLVSKTVKKLKLDIDSKGVKSILDAVSWKDEEAKPVLKMENGKIAIDNNEIKVENGTVIYPKGFKPDSNQLSLLYARLFTSDSDLRDTENVPLDQDIHEYFEREVLQHIPDAWIDESKTVKGYEISFTRYFYNYVPPRSIEEITAEIFELEKETEGILNEIVND